MFKKYNSLENSYQAKFISKFVDNNPELSTQSYIITEKLDGANIQVYFEPNTKRRLGKRTSFIGDNDGFFHIETVIPAFEERFENIQKYVNMTGNKVRIFGEIFGEGIQKRVNYGPKTFAFFDVEVNDILLAPRDSMHMLEGFNLPRVPFISFAPNLSEALSINEEFSTQVNPVPNNTSEGLVIRPFNKNYFDHNGNIFVLKKKSAKFSEKEDKNKPVKVLDTKVFVLNQKFKVYLNENRVLSVFSKSGPMTETKQIGEYIKLVLEDAKEDFLKENDISGLDKNQLKDVYNVGTTVVLLLKKQLGG